MWPEENKTPLWKLLDGDVSSWSVLDPMEDARFTIRLPQPVTVVGLGVAVTVSKGLALPAALGSSTIAVASRTQPGGAAILQT